MMAVIASIVYFTVGEYMEDEAMQRFQIVVMRAHREIQRRLSDVYVANINSLHEIERDVDVDYYSYPTIILKKENSMCHSPPAIRQTW